VRAIENLVGRQAVTHLLAAAGESGGDERIVG
jgi:hypothetical protein